LCWKNTCGRKESLVDRRTDIPHPHSDYGGCRKLVNPSHAQCPTRIDNTPMEMRWTLLQIAYNERQNELCRAGSNDSLLREDAMNTEQRLNRIERQVRTLIVLLGVSVLGLVFLGATGSSTQQVFDDLRCKSFSLVGDEGQPRVAIRLDEKGNPSLSLIDVWGSMESGWKAETRIRLSSDVNFAFLHMFNDGKRRVNLGTYGGFDQSLRPGSN
jgi:hypothetical protein